MSRLIMYILLFASFTSSAQVDYFTLTKASGVLIGMVEHVAPENPDGTLPGVMVWLHGIEANKSAPANVNDTTRISIVTGKGPLKHVLSNPLPLFQKPGGSATDLSRWSIVAPQNRTGQWDCECVTKTFDYIRANPSKWDTSLIILVGYSLGGGGARKCAEFSAVLPYVKYVVDIAGGYNSSPNYTSLAASGINIDVFATTGDALVPISVPDAWVNGIKAKDPVVVPNYFRFSDLEADNNPTDHNKIVQIIAEDTTAGDSYLMTNGDTWQRTETIFHRGLRFKGPRRKHLGIELFFIASLFPLTRRKKNKQ